MPILSITTTARDVLFGPENLDALVFKNGSAAGIIFIRNKQTKQNVVTSTDYEVSLEAGAVMSMSKSVDGEGIIGPWEAISDTAGGVTLEIMQLFRGGSRQR